MGEARCRAAEVEAVQTEGNKKGCQQKLLVEAPARFHVALGLRVHSIPLRGRGIGRQT